MLLRLSGLILSLFIAGGGIAQAQDMEGLPYFNRGDIQAAISRALRAAAKLKCGDAPCEKATTEEFVTPPISEEEARIALLSGARSARLEWCGLDWRKRAYSAMMLAFQSQGIYDNRKLALLSFIHNEQYGQDYARLQVLKTCSEATRANYNEQNPVIELPPWQRVLNNVVLDQSVSKMIQRVLAEIHKSRCGPDQCQPMIDQSKKPACKPQFCTPATDEEKANPPVTIEQARRAMSVGLMSGVAEFCAIDWEKRIFLPFIAYHRRALAMSGRQVAMVAVLHGTMQRYMLDTYRKHEKTCTDKLRASIEDQISRAGAAKK